MHQRITKIRGLAVNIEIVEVHETDTYGGTIWYHAAIYTQAHGSNERKLVRKSRLPDAAVELKKEIEREGIQAFNRVAF